MRWAVYVCVNSDGKLHTLRCAVTHPSARMPTKTKAEDTTTRANERRGRGTPRAATGRDGERDGSPGPIGQGHEPAGTRRVDEKKAPEGLVLVLVGAKEGRRCADFERRKEEEEEEEDARGAWVSATTMTDETIARACILDVDAEFDGTHHSG